MRIIAGTHKGRIINDPKGHVAHPMGDRIRGALFNKLFDINGLNILDAYAGSGVIAIEAVSRGAKSAVAVEKSPKIYKTAKENVELLSLEDKIKVTRANVASWSDNNLDKKFDIVICDPPFDKLNLQTIASLGKHLDGGGLLVLSHQKVDEEVSVKGFSLANSADYGQATLSFYTKQ